MSTSKHIDVICLAGACLTLLLTMAFMCGEALGIQEASVEMGYEFRLFDTSQVHTIDILMEDWVGFLETCQDKEYAQCSLVIDGETYNYSRVINMRATAYTTENKSWKWTASGTTARVGAVAVDRDVIPLGTKLYIVAADGSWCYGIATAEDTGVKGNKVDIFLNTYNECIYFGVRDAVVYVLED